MLPESVMLSPKTVTLLNNRPAVVACWALAAPPKSVETRMVLETRMRMNGLRRCARTGEAAGFGESTAATAAVVRPDQLARTFCVSYPALPDSGIGAG
jgi:hypothetical protein